jgi:hypothetical protein
MSQRPGVLKSCLFGCLGLVALFMLFVGITAVIAGVKLKDSRPVDSSRTPVEAAGGAALDMTHAGRLILDVSQAEMTIKPAAPGEQLNVRVKYDGEVHELRESYDVNADSSWVYALTLRQTMPGMQAIFRQIMGGSTAAKVEVRLPAELPLGLEIRLKQGGAEAELGGLWITSADIAYSQGGFALEFDEPLQEPMDHLVINGGMGGFAVDGVGNASPRTMVVDSRMGGADIGLDGAWRQDCDIRLKIRMGGMDVRVPDNVLVEGTLTDVGALRSADREVPLPLLRFTIEQSMGEIEVR